MDDQEEPDDPASVAANEVVPAPEPDTTAADEEESTRDSSLEMFEQPAPSPPPPLPPPVNVLDEPVVHMEIELARIQQGMLSPVIVISNINNVPEVQATVEISTDQGNEEEEDDTVPIPLEPEPAAGSDGPLPDVAVEEPIELSDSSPNRSGQMFTPRRKKRKRAISPKKLIDTPVQSKDEDEEGLLCPICFDAWTLTGDHRVVSLKCGHLFGMSCIKRWMQNNPAATRGCATCKARATMRDIRFIYARAIKAVDNTREEELLQELNREKLKVIDLNTKLTVVNMKVLEQSEKIDTLERKLLAFGQGGAEFSRSQFDGGAEHRHSYKLFLEKNIEITRESGCRALAYSAKHQLLLISQKSTQPLFPGYSIRMLQVPGFVASAGAASMLVSSRSVRDIAIDASDDLFACAAMEKMVKVFSIQNRSVQCTITPSQDPLWSCAFDKERSKFLYLGSQRGSVYVYDIRQPDQLLEEFRVGHGQNDYTGVVKICPVEPTSIIPCGGFLVCKLKSIWFYEYTPTQQIESHLLNITGAFSAMSYNPDSGLILVSVRPTTDKPTTLVLATLEKLDGVFALKMQHTFEGSRVQTVMYRCAQVYLNDADTLVASYVEDSKMLSTWCTNRGRLRVQQLPMNEGILDICPIRATPGQTYLAALSECRCRIYRLNTE
ncbi:E3 ubiquitin-protein ligase RFWD3 [Anopheles merus]|uniref:RING-type E3 ubiquitin transferase n=1 Tax=Anopheles merus TaxID=30066 RepID=A0A182V3T5_ANOME|nr:E3 ubiquitin-protein ligase RFWD3 [Anopheles merus]